MITFIGYAFDLKCYEEFLKTHNRSINLEDLTSSTSQRFAQEQVLNMTLSLEHYKDEFRICNH
jgi:hypothetical protein